MGDQYVGGLAIEPKIIILEDCRAVLAQALCRHDLRQLFETAINRLPVVKTRMPDFHPEYSAKPRDRKASHSLHPAMQIAVPG